MEKELVHFSHLHPLNWFEEQLYQCRICCEIKNGPAYGCSRCHFYIHEKCADLLREINHPLHPKHPLKLSDTIFDKEFSSCNICKLPEVSIDDMYLYKCFICNFFLHPKCVLQFPQVVKMKSHDKHTFSLYVKHITFTCDACGEVGNVGCDAGDAISFICSTCFIIVHKDCLLLPPTIKTTRHQHPIQHYFSLETEDKWSCEICLQKVSTDHGFYSCQECHYFAHTKCATRRDIMGLISNGEDGDILVYRFEHQGSFDLDSTFQIFKHNNNMIPTEIKHFSHEHNLVYDEQVAKDKRCNMCGLPISSPFYKCIENENVCRYFVHRKCVELPRIKPHPFHPHPLHLTRVQLAGVWCNACSFWLNGFAYQCPYLTCDFDLDIQCAAFGDTITHMAHEHTLMAYFDMEPALCCACSLQKCNFFKCADCNYVLDFTCAKLPAAARHHYDIHPMTLMYKDDIEGQYVCEICEGDRNPNHWFYHCADCNFDAHTDCVVKKDSYLIVGSTIDAPCHMHPLILVQKTINFPDCNHCSKSCTELSLECEKPDCHFISHWQCAVERGNDYP